MCFNCFSTTEVFAANAAMASGLGSHVAHRLRFRLNPPELRLRRRQEAWDQDAAFLAGLGLDPIESLGRRPGDLREAP